MTARDWARLVGLCAAILAPLAVVGAVLFALVVP